MNDRTERTERPGPVVSFLSAAYRTEELVGATIDSVRAQTRPDWELVVVDNGMSDEIAAVVEGYRDPRIVLVRHENRGLVGAVTSAAAVARGRWFAVLNSDDQIAPEYLEHMLGIVEADPSIDALAPDAHFLVRPDRVLRRTFTSGHPRMRDSSRPLTLADLAEGLMPYYTALVRREVWAAVGGFRECDRAEDFALWVDLVAGGHNLHVTDRPVGRWRVDPASVTHQPDSRLDQEASRQAMIGAAVARSGRAEDAAAHERGRRHARFEQSWARYQSQLALGDFPAAKRSARDVATARPTARMRTIAAATVLAPRAVRWVYRHKARAQQLLLPVISRRITPPAGPADHAGRGR